MKKERRNVLPFMPTEQIMTRRQLIDALLAGGFWFYVTGYRETNKFINQQEQIFWSGVEVSATELRLQRFHGYTTLSKCILGMALMIPGVLQYYIDAWKSLDKLDRF